MEKEKINRRKKLEKVMEEYHNFRENERRMNELQKFEKRCKIAGFVLAIFWIVFTGILMFTDWLK